MSETIDESLGKWKPEAEKATEKLPIAFQFGRCKATVVTAQDGKRHIELDCKSKEARDEAAAVFEEEVILRVNPKVILEDEPPVEPDTRLNPIES